MAGAGDIRAGRAFVELFVKDQALSRGLHAASRKLQSFATGIGSMGSMLIGSILTARVMGAVHSFTKTGGAIAEMSARTGMAVQTLSALGYAASQTSVELEDVDTGVKRMQRSITQAAKGSDEAAKAFSNIGLSFKDLMGKSPDEQFAMVSRAMAKIADPTLRAGAALTMFGRSGTKLLPMILEMDELTARAHKLGLVMDTEAAESAHKLERSLSELGSIATRTGQVIMEVIGHSITDVAKKIGEWAIEIKAFVSEHKEFANTLFKASIAVLAVAGALKIGSTAIAIGAVTLARLSVVIGALTTVCRSLGSAFMFVARAFAAWQFEEGGIAALAGSMAVGIAAAAVLVVGTIALVAVWANAEAQAISWGESVLDLTHRLTGLRNAYSDLKEMQSNEKTFSEHRSQANVAMGIEAPTEAESLKEKLPTKQRAAAEAIEADIEKINKELKTLYDVNKGSPNQKRLNARAKEAADIAKGLRGKEGSSDAEWRADVVSRLADPDRDIRKRLQQQRELQEKKLAELLGSETAVGRVPVEGVIQATSSILSATKSAGRSIGGALWDGVREAYKDVLRPFLMESNAVSKIRAEIIEDPTARAKEKARLDTQKTIYDLEVKANNERENAAKEFRKQTPEGNEKGKEHLAAIDAIKKESDLAERLGKEKLAAIDAIHAREQEQGNKELTDAMVRAQIEAANVTDNAEIELGKRRELLELERQIALEKASKAKLNTDLVNSEYDAKIAAMEAEHALRIKQGNEGLTDEMNRAKIEEKFANNEAAKRKALLQLDWDKAKEDAGKKGLDAGLVNQTFAARMRAMEAVTNTSVAGTFAGRSLAGMGMGSPEKQTADNTKAANGHLRKLIDINGGVKTGLDALASALQFA